MEWTAQQIEESSLKHNLKDWEKAKIQFAKFRAVCPTFTKPEPAPLCPVSITGLQRANDDIVERVERANKSVENFSG